MTLSPIERILPDEDSSFRDVIRFLADIVLSLSEDGHVLKAFARAGHPAESLVETWVKGEFRGTLTDESRSKFDRALSAALADSHRPVEIEVNHRIGEAFGLPVSYSLHWQGDGRSVLLVGRDRQDIASAQQKLMVAQVDTERAGQRSRHVGTTLLAVLDAVPEPIFILNEGTGEVEDANPEGNRLLGRDGSDPSFRLSSTARIDGHRLVLDAEPKKEFALDKLHFRRGASHMMIAVVREGDKVGSTGTDNAFDHAAIAVAITDPDGRILSTNLAFSSLADADNAAPNARIGHNIADMLLRGTLDLDLVMVSVRSKGVVAGYSTVLNTPDPRVPVTLTAFRLSEAAGSQVAWMFRESQDRQEGDDASGMLSDMVGQLPLTEIIEQSTVEIERQCIEEALKRTGDNRAAAASLLGISRQSLYVKLRRFGIESKS